MKRRLYNILSALSLLLFVATVVLWVRSYWQFDRLLYLGPAADSRVVFEISSQNGSVGASYSHGNQAGILTINRRFILISLEAEDNATTNMMEGLGGWYRLGFGYAHFIFPPLRVMIVMIPHWLLLLLFAALPTIRFVRFRKHRHRLRKGLCLKCGYDLRASEDRCPECGTLIPADVKRMPME